MTGARIIGSRGAGLVLLVAGLLTVLLSFKSWATCPTTPCGGILMSISEYSGLDLGFGVVTALAGALLAAIGLDFLRRGGASRFATAAVLLALLIIVTVGASVVWMYVIPGNDKQYYWAPATAVLVGIVGLIALAGSLWSWRATLPRP